MGSACGRGSSDLKLEEISGGGVAFDVEGIAGGGAALEVEGVGGCGVIFINAIVFFFFLSF